MAIKWIVMDMDGTLLNGKDKISEKTKAALMHCQEQGIRLILASGRSKYRLYPYVKELELEKYQGSLIEVNGMAITTLPTWGRDVFQRLKSKQIHEVFDFIQPYEIEVQGYLDDTLYTYNPASLLEIKRQYRESKQLPEDYPWAGGAWECVSDLRGGYPCIYNISDVSQLPLQLNKMTYVHTQEKMEEIYPVVMEHFQDRFEIVRTCPRILEITAKGITKGKTLAKFMDKHQIDPKEIIAFGDGENDVEMFGNVYYSVAMGNAMDYVKEKARFCTNTNEEDGIANFLEELNIL